jgi:hypothetical protein
MGLTIYSVDENIWLISPNAGSYVLQISLVVWQNCKIIVCQDYGRSWYINFENSAVDGHTALIRLVSDIIFADNVIQFVPRLFTTNTIYSDTSLFPPRLIQGEDQKSHPAEREVESLVLPRKSTTLKLPKTHILQKLQWEMKLVGKWYIFLCWNSKWVWEKEPDCSQHIYNPWRICCSNIYQCSLLIFQICTAKIVSQYGACPMVENRGSAYIEQRMVSNLLQPLALNHASTKTAKLEA